MPTKTYQTMFGGVTFGEGREPGQAYDIDQDSPEGAYEQGFQGQAYGGKPGGQKPPRPRMKKR